MNGYSAQAGAATTAPPIPGLDQGNPAVSNRPAPPGGAVVGPGQPGGPPGVIAGTPEQIRDQIREQIQNMAREGTMPVINIPPDFVQNAVPRGAVDITYAFFTMIAFIIVGLPLARAFARRMDARSQALASGAADLRPSIEQLQQSVDAMSLEMERITEAQRFQSKLLAGREKEAVRLER